jgi:hypothetical protein
MERQCAAWSQAITHGTPSPVGLEYTLALMRVLFAAEESSSTGCEVVL